MYTIWSRLAGLLDGRGPFGPGNFLSRPKSTGETIATAIIAAAVLIFGLGILTRVYHHVVKHRYTYFRRLPTLITYHSLLGGRLTKCHTRATSLLRWLFGMSCAAFP